MKSSLHLHRIVISLLGCTAGIFLPCLSLSLSLSLSCSLVAAAAGCLPRLLLSWLAASCRLLPLLVSAGCGCCYSAATAALLLSLLLRLLLAAAGWPNLVASGGHPGVILGSCWASFANRKKSHSRSTFGAISGSLDQGFSSWVALSPTPPATPSLRGTPQLFRAGSLREPKRTPSN